MSILEGCPICGGSGRSTIPFNRDQRAKAWLRDAGLPEHYQWFLCQSCGNAYQRPSSVPAVARRFWETHTHDHENSRRGADTVYEAIAPHLRGATMLDVGCGLGYLVRRFTDAGWDAFGIDPTPAHKAVHESLGVQTAIALAEEFEPGRRFDAILSCYAIYFVSDPVRFLQGLKGWLLPQGRLCIVISDFLASRDPGLPSYAHSFYPTADSMRFLLATAGFRVERSWGHRSSLYFVAIPSDDVELPNVNVSWTKLLYRTKRIRYQLLGKPIDALIGFASGISRRMRLASNAAHPRFFLYGYFGYHNFGDDLLAAAAVDGIERRLGPCEFYVRNFSDVPTLGGRTNVHLTGCDTILLDKNRTRARRVCAYLWKYWRTFYSCDAFVMAGGTYFHDRTTKSVALLAAICLMARMRRMKIFAMGVGVSTLRTRRARILLSVIARLSDTFAVRDQQSFRQVEGKGRRVLLAADLAFDLPIRHLQPRSESRIIGIALAGPAIEEDAGIRANLIPAIEAAIDRFVADGWSVRLLEMQCCELSEGNRIGDSDILAEIARGRAEWVTMVPMPRCDGAIAELYSGLHAVVGMRFHALVLAALYGVPFVGIAHDAKVEALCESFAMPCLTPHSLRAGEVVDAVVKISGRQPSRDVTEMMTKAAATNFEPIVESFRRAQP